MCDKCRQVMQVRVSDCMWVAEFGHSSFLRFARPVTASVKSG